MLSSLSNPLLPLAFASAVLIAQLWVLIAAGGAKGAFEAFVTSVPFQARVTRSSGLEGPCMALFLTEGPPSRGASLLELGLLPQPTPHQRCKPRLSRIYHTVGPCCAVRDALVVRVHSSGRLGVCVQGGALSPMRTSRWSIRSTT